MLLTFADDARIEAEAGVIDKNGAVDLSHIDLFAIAARDRIDRFFQFQGDFQILGEMIEGSKRQDAKPLFRADQRCRHRADGPVAPPGHDRPRLFLHRLAGNFRQIGAVSRVDNFGFNATLPKKLPDFLWILSRFLTRGFVKNDNHTFKIGTPTRKT